MFCLRGFSTQFFHGCSFLMEYMASYDTVLIQSFLLAPVYSTRSTRPGLLALRGLGRRDIKHFRQLIICLPFFRMSRPSGWDVMLGREGSWQLFWTSVEWIMSEDLWSLWLVQNIILRNQWFLLDVEISLLRQNTPLTAGYGLCMLKSEKKWLKG